MTSAECDFALDQWITFTHYEVTQIFFAKKSQPTFYHVCTND